MFLFIRIFSLPNLGDVAGPVDIVKGCAFRRTSTGRAMAGVGIIDRRKLAIAPKETVAHPVGVVVASDDVALGIEAPGARAPVALPAGDSGKEQ